MVRMFNAQDNTVTFGDGSSVPRAELEVIYMVSPCWFIVWELYRDEGISEYHKFIQIFLTHICRDGGAQISGGIILLYGCILGYVESGGCDFLVSGLLSFTVKVYFRRFDTFCMMIVMYVDGKISCINPDIWNSDQTSIGYGQPNLQHQVIRLTDICAFLISVLCGFRCRFPRTIIYCLIVLCWCPRAIIAYSQLRIYVHLHCFNVLGLEISVWGQ